MAKSRSLSACVVGAGFISTAHIEALRRINIPVVALVGDGQKEADEKSALWGIPQAFGSLEDALAASGADVFHLAVPNALHAPYSKKVLLAGKHVVCEKPLAMTSRESQELVDLARRSPAVAAVAYNLRFYPMVHEIRDRILSGSIGRVHAVHGTYLQDWLLYDTDWNWRLNPSVGGELRAVADIGSHWLDMVSWVTGAEVEQVFGEFSTVHKTRYRPQGPSKTYDGGPGQKPGSGEPVTMSSEDQASVLLRFQGGAVGSLFVSQVSAGRKNALSFQVDGTEGSLSWNSEDPNRIVIGHRDRPNEVLDKSPALLRPSAARIAQYPGGHQEGYPDTFRQFLASVYGYLGQGDPAASRPFPTFADGHREMVCCDALLTSARESRWVTLS